MKKKHLKIAVYSGEIPSTTFIERLIIGLSETEHTLHLFGAQSKKVKYNDSVKVIAYTQNRFQKFCHFLKYSLLLFFFRKKDKQKLDQILKKQSTNLIYSKVKCYPVLWHRPDIFHLQWAKGLEEWSWVQEFGMTLILSLRGAHINYSPIANTELTSMYKTFFPKVDGFHAVSNAIANEAVNYNALHNKIKVVYSGLQMEDFKSNDKIQNMVFEIISIGRPHWIKGYVCAIDACKILKENNFKFKYTIVGGANDIELMYQVNDLGLQDEVELVGQKSFDEVKALIQSVDLLLLSSLKEGVANVALEAIALRTIVLTTDCGGMEEVIKDSVNGFMVPIRDSKKMADAIIKIQQLSQNEKTAIITEGLKTLEEQHTEVQMIEGMLELYKNKQKQE